MILLMKSREKFPNADTSKIISKIDEFWKGGC